MDVKEITSQEFENFINNYNLSSIYQTTEYAYTMSEQNYNHMFIGLVKDGVVIAGSAILIKKESGFKYAYAPRGFLINYEDFYLIKEFTIKLKEFLNSKGIIAIKINPLIVRNVFDFGKQNVERNEKYDLIYESLIHNDYYHLGYNNFFEAIKPRFDAIIDLTIDEKQLFYNIKKEYKTKIRSAINNGIEIQKGSLKELDILYSFTKDKYPRSLDYLKDCYGYFYKNDKIDYYYTKLNTNTYLKNIQKKLSYYEKQSNEFSDKIIKHPKNNTSIIDKKINIDKYLSKYKSEIVNATNLLRKYPDGIITSGILIIRHKKTVTILLDGYDKEYKRFNSKHLLIWHLMALYKKQGFTTFNLGGVSNIMIDSNKYTGLNDFKINFGSKMYEYAGDFELVTNKRNYNLYRNYVPLKNLIKSKLTK